MTARQKRKLIVILCLATACLLIIGVIVGVIIGISAIVRSNKNARLISESAGFELETAECFSSSVEQETVSKPVLPEVVELDVDADYCAVYDVENDFYVYLKNSLKKCNPASLTKLMTASVACDYLSLGKVIRVGREINLINPSSSTAHLTVGLKITFEGLLYAMLLPSGNDAAYVTAVAAGRAILGDDSASIEDALKAFMEKVNLKLAEIGAVSSHFTNPDGITDPEHYTTAQDLIKIAKYAMTKKTVYAVCNTEAKTVYFENGGYIVYRNSNSLIDRTSKYYCKYAVGLKTGTTDLAGNCLIFELEKKGKSYICVVLHSPTKTSRYVDALAIADAVIPD